MGESIRDTAGAVFHKELARELVEFILPIVEREGGTMSLMDIYCVFNRARGVGTFFMFVLLNAMANAHYIANPS